MSNIRDENIKRALARHNTVTNSRKNKIDPIIEDETAPDVITIDNGTAPGYNGLEFNSIGDGAIIVDLNLNIVSLNSSAKKITGWSETNLDGRHIEAFFKIIKKSTRQACRITIDHVANDINRLNNCLLVPRNSSGASLRVNASPIKNEIGEIKQILLVLKKEDSFKNFDISNYYKFKHDNFVTITRGLLHDLNNYFTPLLANLSMLKMDTSQDNENYARILQCEMSLIKAIDFMQKFSLISETSHLKKEIESIAEIVSSSVDLILSGTNIKFELNISESLKPVEVDKNKIILALYNILKIYRESLHDGGSLRISIENYENNNNEFLPLEEMDYIKISIEDLSNQVNFSDMEFRSDHSIDAAENTNALGLTLSFNIIKEHGGLFDYENLDENTKAFIYLPVYSEEVLFLEEKNEQLNEIVEAPAEISNEKKKNVLVMDDNKLVAGTLAEMLLSLGCSVHIVNNGEEALKAYSEACSGDRMFDIAFLDLTIPGGMGAKAIVKSLSAINSDVKFVVLSGSPNHPVMINFKDYGFDTFITKPFDLSQIRSVVEGLMD